MSQAVEGGPGQPISVAIGATTGVSTDREGTREYVLQVEVSNNSDVPVTVTRISVMTAGNGAFQVQPASRTFNEMIDPGKDHQFDIGVPGRLVRAYRKGEAQVVDLRVIVDLSNGDSYFYTFEVPVRDTGI
ncbi:MAG TPA: hypothetical protein VGK04_01665 [Thermoanaerobaculia bacterium]